MFAKIGYPFLYHFVAPILGFLHPQKIGNWYPLVENYETHKKQKNTKQKTHGCERQTDTKMLYWFSAISFHQVILIIFNTFLWFGCIAFNIWY